MVATAHPKWDERPVSEHRVVFVLDAEHHQVAVVVLKEGKRLTIQDLSQHFLKNGFAKYEVGAPSWTVLDRLRGIGFLA